MKRLLVRDIRYPIVAVDIVNAEEIEAIYTHCYILEECSVFLMAVVQYLVAHSDICTAIGGGTETVGFQFSMRRSKWKTIGKGELERQEPLPAAREVIGEEEIHRIPLVGRKRDALAVELHPGIHQR